RDRDCLIAALRQRGVDYLGPSDAKLEASLDESTLIASLASHPDPRLRQGLIALFLLQPELAPRVPPLRAQLDPRAAHELLAHYVAAVFLQEMWRIRLSHYLSSQPRLPDYFSEELGFPKPEVLHGKAGLHALSAWHG